MTYELHEQLKKAGFPFKEVPRDPLAKAGFGLTDLVMFGDDIPYFTPTLTELISECGEDFYQLIYVNPWKDVEYDYKWICYSFGPNPQIKTGNTADEAVAQLYLALKASVSDVRSESEPIHN